MAGWARRAGAVALAVGWMAAGPMALAQSNPPAAPAAPVGDAAAPAADPAKPPAAPANPAPANPAPSDAAPSDAAPSDAAPSDAAPSDAAKQAAAGEVHEARIDDKVYQEIFKILFMALVLSLVLESALAVVFNWRLFLQTFDARGAKPLIAFGFGWFAAAALHIDLMKMIYVATATSPSAATAAAGYSLGWVGPVITGLILAGGSAGVNRILQALGFRSVLTPEDVRPKPPPTKAWVSVRLARKDAVGPVNVGLNIAGATPPSELIGTIVGENGPPKGFRWLFADSLRFPIVAGYAVNPATSYEVVLQGEDKAGGKLTATIPVGNLAAGAMVDLVAKL